MNGQLSLDGDSLVGVSWDAPDGYGRATVLGPSSQLDGYLEVSLVRRDGVESRALLHPVTVRRDAGDAAVAASGRFVETEPEDRWVTVNGRDFVNGTEHLRLAELGLVPLDPDVALAMDAALPSPSGQRPSEARHPVVPASEGVKEMPVAEKSRTRKPAKAKAKKGGLAEATASKAKLRAYLLDHQTVGDSAWLAYRKEHGLPESREKGESREAFVKRVLG